MSYPNERDCEHGRQRGKCPECDLREANVRIGRLLEALTEIKENSYDDGAVYIAKEALETK